MSIIWKNRNLNKKKPENCFFVEKMSRTPDYRNYLKENTGKITQNSKL